MPDADLELAPLSSVPIADITRVLNEPRNARHMPLAGEPFTEDAAARWVAAKESQWQEHGYGPWAVRVGGVFAGWGGFQKEDGMPDLALVLDPRFRGWGNDVARRMLDVGFDELRFTAVVAALPLSRARPHVALARWGFTPDGEASIGGTTFRRFRLTAEAWARHQGSDPSED